MPHFIRRHPVLGYFALAIAISWTGILLITWPTALPTTPADAERRFVPVYLAMLLGPSVAGLLVTAIAGGRPGLRALRDRLLHWRLAPRWYAIALLTAPVILGLTVLLLTRVSDAFVPSLLVGHTDTAGLVRTSGTPSFLTTGLVIGLGAGLFEELGWTGVAVPRVLARRGLLATGVEVGLVWGTWHYLAIHWGSANAAGAVPEATYLAVALFSFLPPYRVLMTWVYRHTQSLLVGILMHASLTSTMLLAGPAVSGSQLVQFDLAFAALLWASALGVLAFERGGASR